MTSTRASILFIAIFLGSCTSITKYSFDKPTLTVEELNKCNAVWPSSANENQPIHESCKLYKLQGVFHGKATYMYEDIGFEPCSNSGAKDTLPNYKKSDIWFDYNPKQKLLYGNSEYLIVEGTIYGPGSYGHFGMSRYLFVPDKIIHKSTFSHLKCTATIYGS